MGGWWSSNRAAEGTVEEAVPPVKVSPWDGGSMKRTIDDHLAEAFCDLAECDTDNRWFDVKLVLMALATVTGLVAQFYPPASFPGNRPVLLWTVPAYLVISVVLQLIAWVVDKDYVFSTKPTEKLPQSVSVRSHMERYDDKYRITVECPRGRQVTAHTFSVAKVFTAAGDFSYPRLQEELYTTILPAVRDMAAKKRA